MNTTLSGQWILDSFQIWSSDLYGDMNTTLSEQWVLDSLQIWSVDLWGNECYTLRTMSSSWHGFSFSKWVFHSAAPWISHFLNDSMFLLRVQWLFCKAKKKLQGHWWLPGKIFKENEAQASHLTLIFLPSCHIWASFFLNQSSSDIQSLALQLGQTYNQYRGVSNLHQI